MDQDLHVVLGASGGAGSALVTELAARGRRVRAVSRHQISDPSAEVEPVAADLMSSDGAAEAVAGATVVFHAAQPELARWLDDFPRMTDNVAAAAAGVDAKLVFADNLYAYGPAEEPLTEDTPQRPAGPRAAMRARMADALLAEHAAGRLRVAIGRASDYFGPGGVGTTLGESVFGAALAGRPVRWLGPLDVPHTMSYLPDVARGLAVLGETDAADGQVWHLPAGDPLSATTFVALLRDALGAPVKLRATGAVGFWVASRFMPVLRDIAETRYQWQRPFVSDTTRFEDAFGALTTTPHLEAVGSTVAWWRARTAAAAAAASSSREPVAGAV